VLYCLHNSDDPLRAMNRMMQTKHGVVYVNDVYY
jgi:hypothetical protein